MNAIYIGVDFHARQQAICYLTTETGERVTTELKHEPKTAVRTFYEQFSGQVIVGLEASGYSPWFERLLEELGHQVRPVMPPRSGAGRAGDRRTIAAMPYSFWI